jgi:hypothetical protein
LARAQPSGSGFGSYIVKSLILTFGLGLGPDPPLFLGLNFGFLKRASKYHHSFEAYLVSKIIRILCKFLCKNLQISWTMTLPT